MTDSKDAYDYVKNAKAKCHSGNYQDAIADYTQAIDIFSRVDSNEEGCIDYADFEEAYNQKALLHILLEEYEEAIFNLKKIINLKEELNSDCINKTFYANDLFPAPELMLIGLCKYQLKDYKSAISYSTKAIESYKSSPSLQDWNCYQLGYVYILRGETKYKLGNIKEAHQDWKIALDLEGLEQALNFEFETPQPTVYPDDFEDWLKTYGLSMVANEFKKYCTNI
tara:strand:+ start:30 stop:704 length:675 start_codon:yes stop_codon:yes gene_type:complete